MILCVWLLFFICLHLDPGVKPQDDKVESVTRECGLTPGMTSVFVIKKTANRRFLISENGLCHFSNFLSQA